MAIVPDKECNTPTLMESAADTEFRVSNEITSHTTESRFFKREFENICYLPLVKCFGLALLDKQYSCQILPVALMSFFR
tara:strand:- start:570 stop:806 length:237 start_codon:yes stop_codon:yes gene_type:complete